VYSLGATLYEVLTLEPAFPGRDRQELLRQIAFEEPRSPRRLNKAIPAELETIVLKALEKNPADRYATAQELANDLERFLKDEPIRARRPTLWLRAKKWARRHKPVVWSAAASVLALLVMALVGLAVNNSLIKGERDAADKARTDAQHRLYEAKLAQAKASRWSGRAGRRFEAYAALKEAAQLAHDLHLGPEAMRTLRNEVIACLALVDLRLDCKWDAYPAGTTTTGIAFDADMQHYARVDSDGNITVRRLADNQETVKITDIGAPPLPGRPEDWRMPLLFSPDGRFLAAAGHPNHKVPLGVWDLQGSKLVLTEAPAGGFERKIDFSPDSRVLAAGLPDGSIAVHDLLAATKVKRFDIGKPIFGIRFNPRGDRLAVCVWKMVHVIDLAGRPITKPFSHPREVSSPSWNADGQRLAVICGNGHAYIWHVGDSRKLADWKIDEYLTFVAFNQRGDLLATAGGDTTRLWDPGSGKEVLRAVGLAGDFSRDDHWLGLGVGGAHVGRWEVSAAEEYRPLYGHQRGMVVHSMDISPDGRLLASAGKDGVRLWDVVLGKLVASLPTGMTYSVIFESGGKSLITSGSIGALRWPIRPTAESFRLGPPAPIRHPQARPTNHASLSADGRIFAARTTHSAAVILDLARPNERPRFIHPAQLLCLSPDGNWLASTVDDHFESKLWNAQTGKWVKDFPGIRSANVQFSPDSRWLVFGTGREYVFHRVGTWQPCLRLPRDSAGYHRGAVAFTRDSKTAAIAYGPRVIRLIDVESGRELATLEAPATDPLTVLAFTSDNRRLLAGTANGMIQLWNLRRIREQLRELSLDWDPLSELPKKTDDLTPLLVEADLGDLLDREKYSLVLAFFPFHAEAHYRRGLAHLRFEQSQAAVQDFTMALALRPNFADAYWKRGQAHGAANQPKQAIADYTKFLTMLPPDDRRRGAVLVRRAGNSYRLNNHAQVLADLLEFAQRDYELPVDLVSNGATLCNNQAWHMVTGPEKLRDAPKALPLAKKAVELLPEQATYRNTLGVVTTGLENTPRPWIPSSAACATARDMPTRLICTSLPCVTSTRAICPRPRSVTTRPSAGFRSARASCQNRGGWSSPPFKRKLRKC
jgi:WD40 repeat protein